MIADLPSGPVIKRVALLGGDRRIQFHSGSSWVDMTLYGEPLKAKGYAKMRALPVPEGTAFLLGDNIDVSVDSRSFGPVPISRLRLVVGSREPGFGAGVSGSSPRHWMAVAGGLHDWRPRMARSS